MSFAQELFKKRSRHELSDFDGAIAIQKRAKDLGMSLAKYLDTDEGHNANQSLVRVRFYEQQAQCAVGDGHAEFNAVRKEVRSAVSMNYDAPSASTADAPVRGTASWNAEVERTMKD